MKKRKYQDKYVAFIDILGFKKKVEESISDDNIYNKIHAALKEFLSEKMLSTKLPVKGENITTFSDSIVWSVPADDSDNLLYLGLSIIHLQIELFRYEVLIRGGIAKGKIYHTNEIVFGPAFNEAYELESKYAIYPRIVMNKELYDQKIKDYPNYLGVELDKKIFKSVFAKEPLTNLCFVDTLNCLNEIEYDNYLLLIENVKQIIIDNLVINYPKDIKMKYVWMDNYYNASIRKYKNIIDTKEFLIDKSIIKF